MVEYADGKCRGTIQSGPRKGEPCRARPKTGSVLCGAHGGHLPKVKRAAQFRLARDEAQQELIRRMKDDRSEEHTSELQSPDHLVCRLLLEKKKRTALVLVTGCSETSSLTYCRNTSTD